MYKTGDKVEVHAEFFNDGTFDHHDCEIVSVAPEKIEDGVNLHDACYLARRLSDGREIVIYCDLIG